MLKSSIKEANEQNLKVLATKEDITTINEKIAGTNEKIANLRGELKTDIANSKTDMVKWMVGFWLAQMAAIIGLYLKK